MNLVVNGIVSCARWVKRELRREDGCFHVYADDTGRIRMTRMNRTKKALRPENELVGTFTKDTEPEYIEDCLLLRLREINGGLSDER